MFDELRNSESRELEEPQTHVEGGGNLETQSFTERERNRERLEDYETAYKQSETVAQLVDTRALMTFGTGAEFIDKEPDPEIQVVDGEALSPAEWLNRVFTNLDNRLVQLGTDAYVYGDAFLELIETEGGGFDRLVSVNPKTLEAKFDDKGQIQEWRQVVGRDNRPGSVSQTFGAEEIAHFKLHQLGRKPLGVSLIGRNWDAITRYEANRDATQEALRQHGFTRWHVTVEGAVDDRDVRRVRTKFRNNQYQTLVTGDNIQVESLDTGGAVGDGIQNILNADVQTLAAGFGVPEEMAGLGRGSTEATAKVRLQAFERAARAEQRKLADQFIEQVANVVLGEFSPYSVDAGIDLEFGDVVSDQSATSEWLRNFDQYFTPDEVREQLGLGPVPQDVDEDDLGPPGDAAAAGEAGGAGGIFGEAVGDGGRQLAHPDDLEEFWMPVIENVLWSDDNGERMLFEFDDSRIPQFVMDALESAIPDAVAEASSNISTMDAEAVGMLSETMLDSLDPKHGWSVQSISGHIQDIPGAELTKEQADVLARDITHSAVAKAREEGYRQRDDVQDLKFDWVGPVDDRNAEFNGVEVCNWIRDQIPDEGVSLDELKDLVAEANEKFVPHDGREWSPHIQCRSQPIRTVNN